MLDEHGREGPRRDAVTAREPLPIEPPELCSAEFNSSRDLRFAVNKGGSLVCYFRSEAHLVSPKDVAIDVDDRIFQAHTVSALGGGVWQANVLLDEPLTEGLPVRIRLGESAWSTVSPAREIR
jgi:hypothetical protein